MTEHGIKMAAVVVFLAAGFSLIPRGIRSCDAGTHEDAPNFHASIVANAPVADQKSLELNELHGKPVVLDFWATWCGPCNVSAPIVNSIAQRYRDRGLVVVGVNVDDEPALVPRFVQKKNLTFPIVFDDGKAISRDYGATTLPTLVVVGKDGKIAAVRHGVTSESDLDALVKRVL